MRDGLVLRCDRTEQQIFGDNLPLPLELFAVIAEHLVGDLKFGSLANLNVSCRAIRNVTNSVLWVTLTLDAISPGWNPLSSCDCATSRFETGKDSHLKACFKSGQDGHVGSQAIVPHNRRYVKYLILAEDTSIEPKSMLALFPRLNACFKSCDQFDDHLPTLGPKTINLSVFKPVPRFSLFDQILRTPIRRGSASEAEFLMPVFVACVDLYETGSITEDGHFENSAYPNLPALRLWTSEVSLGMPNETSWLQLEHTGVDEMRRYIATAMELLKVVERTPRATSARSPFPRRWRNDEVFIPTEDHWYEHWGHGEFFEEMPHYLCITLNPQNVQSFLKQFSEAVQKYPHILRNRLLLFCEGGLSQENVIEIIRSVGRYYALHPEHITLSRYSQCLVTIRLAWGSPSSARGTICAVESEALRKRGLQLVVTESVERGEKGRILFSDVIWLEEQAAVYGRKE